MTKLSVAKTPNSINIQLSNCIPEGNMSGQGAWPREFTMYYLSNRDYRAMMLYDFLLTWMLFEFDHMCYGQVSCKMLCDQVVQFGGQTLEDDNRCGRPVTIVTVNNVKKSKHRG